MNYKKFLSGSLLLTTFFLLSAENNIKWINKNYDFGYIREEDGVSKGTFRFINKGKKPIEIKDVKVSCGCTETFFTKGLILKGDTAQINVSYDPEERPGKFKKGIYVFFKDENMPVHLGIEGVVIASPETLELFYPYCYENLCFDTMVADFGEMPQGLRRREFIDIYNSGSSPIKPIFQSDSDLIRVDFQPEEIRPGDKATLTIYLDSSAVMWTGNREYKIDINIDNRKIGEITAKATILPSTSQL